MVLHSTGQRCLERESRKGEMHRSITTRFNLMYKLFKLKIGNNIFLKLVKVVQNMVSSNFKNRKESNSPKKYSKIRRLPKCFLK